MSKILVIDDKKDNLLSIKAIINTYKPDYKVLTAQSGEDGIKLANTQKPDTILLDIIMPEMDGYEVCKRLKEEELTRHIPIIFLTAIKTSTQDRIKGLDIGADGYIIKPVEPGDLIAQTNAMLRIKEAEDGLRLEKDLSEQKVLERTKELNCLYNIAEVVGLPEIAPEQIFEKTVNLLPLGWQYPEITCARITIINEKYITDNFLETKWKQSVDITIHEEIVGEITICYLEEKPGLDEGPFLKEERNLIEAIAERLGKTIEQIHTDENLKKTEIERELALKSALKANSVKTLFLANISHEIRTPLTSILGFTDLIEDRVKESSNEYLRECFDHIKTSGDRLMKTVHGVLDLSLMESGTYPHNPKSVQISKIIEHIIIKFKPNADQRNIELSFENQTEDFVITADPENLNKALDSIIDNAIKYTEVGKVLIKLEYEYDKYVLKIIDTGVGIKESYLDRIFDTFTQESDNYHKEYQGLGVGMAIAKYCLELDGTSIAIDSIKDKGTTVTLSFNPD